MGKTITCQLLARELDVPFIELSRAIEALAGCSVREIHDLYGTTAYRRYERRALEEAIQIYPEAVIATPGVVEEETTGGVAGVVSRFTASRADSSSRWSGACP